MIQRFGATGLGLREQSSDLTYSALTHPEK